MYSKNTMTSVVWYKKYSYLYLPALYLVLGVLLDVTMYAFMGLPFPSDYLYSLAIMTVVAAVLCLTQRKWVQVTFVSLLLAVQLFTCVANILSYGSLSEVFSWETIHSIVNAVIASTSARIDTTFVIPLVALAVVYVVAVILICHYFKTPVVKRQRRVLQPVLCALLVATSLLTYGVAYWTLPAYADQYLDNLTNRKFVYDTFSNRVQSFKMFGSYSYYLNNLLALMSLKSAVTTADTFGITVKDYQPDSYGYETIAQMPKGDNLIMILMETFERAAINPYTMPNLYQFMHENCYTVDGYYSIERTCLPDYLSQTGTHVLGKEMWSAYGDTEIPFSLANIFNRAGYTTNAFHNGDGSFYNRNNLYTKALGFDHFYDYYALSTQYKAHFNGNKDELLFEENLTKIAPADQDFYSYVVSISTHGLAPNINLQSLYPDEFALIEQNYDELADLYPWLTSNDKDKVQIVKNYLAGTVTFDRGFGALIAYLRKTDDLTVTNADGSHPKLIETTALVMFGDHYYYLNPLVVQKEPTVANPNDLIGNQCPFIVYNPYALNDNPEVNPGRVTYATNALAGEQAQPLGQTIKRFTATMDLYKTTCSLFGIVTDQQLTYGHSIFTDQQSVGIGYINGYIWGETSDGKAWRTVDYQEFAGVTPSATELAAVEPLLTQTFNSIIANMTLYEGTGFKNLTKSYYTLGSFVAWRSSTIW